MDQGTYDPKAIFGEQVTIGTAGTLHSSDNFWHFVIGGAAGGARVPYAITAVSNTHAIFRCTIRNNPFGGAVEIVPLAALHIMIP